MVAMNKNTKPLPRLDLAPKLTRPLSLWNLLDYLRLLYWVFYFPQALRWYVNTFGDGYIDQDSMSISKGLQILREDFIQRRLLIQGIILILSIPTSFCWFLEQFGFVVDWSDAILGVVSGIAINVTLSISSGVTLGVSSGVASGVANGVILGIILYIASSVASGVVFDVLLYVLLGVVFGMTFGIAIGIAFGITFGVAISATNGISSRVSLRLANSIVFSVFSGVVFGIASSIACALLLDIASGVLFGAASGMTFTIASSLVFCIVILRPDNWLASTPANWLSIQNRSWLFPRVTVLPLPTLHDRLESSLSSNWQEGVHNSNELFQYSYQFIPVVNAINDVLQETADQHLVWKIAHLADQPYDWELVAFASISLKEQLQATFKHNLQTWPVSNSGITESPRLDTFPRATAAGFWYLHKKDPTNAIKAFREVREILYGEEMYVLALTLNLCKRAETFHKIHSLTLPHCPETDPEKRLRQTSWLALEAFQRVIQDTRLIHQSSSRTTRAQALARTQGELTHILDRADQLPQAEGGLIIDIATTWRDALLGIASDIGHIDILEPIQNPYIIGDPVSGSHFVGREDIMRELESLWLGAENPPSVLIYGHRRMGKTSILCNLTGGSDLKLIYVNLQLLGSVTQGVSEVLLAITDEIAPHLNIPAPPDEAFLHFPERTFERYLRVVLNQLDCRTLIIALDEFEIIEELIEAGELSPNFMAYLRGLIQMDKRLTFALAGLHTLDEMTRDYFQPFFGSIYPVRVGYLSAAATRTILETPTDDFPLEYHPDAVNEIYRLTHGQPYLVQLIGFYLVRRFNELVFETNQSRDPILTVEDVGAATNLENDSLFRTGRYYFEGIWNQAMQHPPGQTDILCALAPHPSGLSIAELQYQCPHIPDLQPALDTLKRHDVVAETEERWYIQVELCRRWIEAMKCE